MTLPLAIIQLENPPESVMARVGNQQRWFVQALGLTEDQFIVVRPDLEEHLPDPATVCGAILSGSWAMVTDRAAWSERTAAWIRHAMTCDLPLLGVCYGHQLMAHALGGEVGDNPKGWERGLQQLTLNPLQQPDPLISGLPARFSAWLSHRQSVLAAPPGAQVLASSDKDACQIIRYSPQAISVQFHPEFTQEIMTACLQNSLGEAEATGGTDKEAEWPHRMLLAFKQQLNLSL